VRGGTRIEFLCGGRALGDYGEKHRMLTSLGASMSTDWRELAGIIEKLVSENKSMRKERDGLSRELAGFRAAETGKPTGEIGRYKLVRRIFDSADIGEVREMATKIKGSGENIILFGIVSPVPGLVFACNPAIGADMGTVLRKAAAVTGGKGGGGKDFAQGGGGDPSKIEEALDAAERDIREMLE
jgi:alanyl-tRNA synthetase